MPILTTDRHRRMRVGIGLVSIAIVLAGCSLTTPPHAVSTSTTSPATHPVASGSATASPSEPADVDPADVDPTDWEITFNGVGPLVLAGSLSAGTTATGSAYKALPPGSCPNPAMTILKSSSHPTIWVQATADASDEIGLIAVGGDATGDPREAGSPKTREGISVGSTFEELKAAYPRGRVEEGDALPHPRLVLSGSSSSGVQSYLVFEVYEGVVQTILVQRNADPISEFCG